MSRSSTKDMFYQDLNAAFIHLIKFTLSPSVHDAKIHDVDWYICPPADLPLYGNCFCDYALQGYDHDYTNCNEINLPYPSIISTNPDNHVDSVVKLCPYLDQRIPENGVRHNHRLSCFKPVKSAEIFMNWFMSAPADSYDYTRWELNKDERRAIEDLVDDYEGWVPVNGARGSWRQKKVMLCRLMGCFRGEDIPDDAYHSPAQWEAQRLLEVLQWRELKFKTCLQELRSAMKEVVQIRMGEPPNERKSRRSSPVLQEEDLEDERRSGGAVLQTNNTAEEMSGSGKIP
ncbi:hypothetical protein TsFJ059_001874 [Trichoderma semiorbis]|uniref:Uncharacterized protein n=1 Tax=Trichoderma semiorbis TaxID=1491008 RepID=A0A9P8KTE4_9HYPO|nr:hypothetical protein TsFJ059_001874 [Trichoderma semiorbis]